MERLKPPRVPEQVLPHYSVEQARQVVRVCKERTVLGARDKASILVLLDTGMRAAELVAMQTEDIAWDEAAILVHGKGGKQRQVAMGPTTARALDRYLRTRGSESPFVWLSERAGERLSVNGLRMAMARRFKEAGVPFAGVHAWRRTSGIMFLDAGGNPEDLKELMGWSSHQMLAHYTKAAAGDRAKKAHRRFSPTEQLGR